MKTNIIRLQERKQLFLWVITAMVPLIQGILILKIMMLMLQYLCQTLNLEWE